MINTLRRLIPCLLLLTSLGLFLPTTAAAMRCGSALISKGDAQAKVVRYCGDPVQTSQRFITRRGFYAGTRLDYKDSEHAGIATGRYYPYGYNEVLVEEWIFNLGPNKLMRLVKFENGIVVDVDTLEYGYLD